jgi:hypothetical protein
MKIEEGKFYRTHEGQKKGQMVFDRNKSLYPWMCQSSGHTFTEEGRFLHMSEDNSLDLVAEWSEEPAKPEPAAPKLWRDMTPEEKGALLLAHHEGKLIESRWLGENWTPTCAPEWYLGASYRIRPEPKRETVTLYTAIPSSVYQWLDHRMEGDTHKVTLPLVDGDMPLGIYTSPDGHTIIVERIK